MSGADESACALVKSDVYAALERVGVPLSFRYGARVVTGDRRR
jgi:hypothetical protein